MSKLPAALGIIFLAAVALPTQAAGRLQARTEAAVLAADDDWLAAEQRGDVPALEARLAPGYRDIEPNGTVHLKAELLAFTARRQNKATGRASEVAAGFRAKHPAQEKVLIVGNTAVLSFHSIDPTEQALVRSVDVFAYQNGMWRGVLSSHASVAVPAK